MLLFLSPRVPSSSWPVGAAGGGWQQMQAGAGAACGVPTASQFINTAFWPLIQSTIAVSSGSLQQIIHDCSYSLFFLTKGPLGGCPSPAKYRANYTHNGTMGVFSPAQCPGLQTWLAELPVSSPQAHHLGMVQNNCMVASCLQVFSSWGGIFPLFQFLRDWWWGVCGEIGLVWVF